jgi:hypothetical protein
LARDQRNHRDDPRGNNADGDVTDESVFQSK